MHLYAVHIMFINAVNFTLYNVIMLISLNFEKKEKEKNDASQILDIDMHDFILNSL